MKKEKFYLNIKAGLEGNWSMVKGLKFTSLISNQKVAKLY